MDVLWRTIASGFSLPAALATGALFRRLNGPAAVLDLRVTRLEGVQERAAQLHALRRAALEPSIAAVLLRLDGPPGGFAACEDLRATIGSIRRAGKPVYAFVESPGNAVVWIAAACERVFCVPTGEIGFVGVGVELTFFGAALERLGLTPDFEAAGEYKSFGEPWTRSFPSAANHEAMGELLTDLHERLIADVAADRKLDPDVVREAIGRAPLSADEAVEVGLVDEVLYEDQLHDWLESRLGKRSRRVSFGGWAARDGWLEWIEQWGEGARKIAVLHLEGTIVMEGRTGGRPSIQARKVVPILRALREDERVAAVVLHVNSPGGHATAADLMWREVEALQKAKPVVASYEDVSASGGVYLSAPAVEILARSTTLTGSIGVFGGKVVAGEGLRRVGVHVHEVSLAPNATMFSPQKRFTDGQRVRFRSMLQRFYDGFVQKVADGRRMAVAEIEPSCRGRVWTGHHALERRLIDRRGDLEDAVDRARSLAGLHQGGFVRVHLSAEPKTWLQRQVQQAIKQLNPAAALTRFLTSEFTALTEVVLEHPAEPLAMMPFEVQAR